MLVSLFTMKFEKKIGKKRKPTIIRSSLVKL